MVAGISGREIRKQIKKNILLYKKIKKINLFVKKKSFQN